MPTVVFVSPKGGVGKTSAALILACELARQARVVILDADPNRPLRTWAGGNQAPPNLSIESDVNEDNIVDQIEAAARQAPFVIVDLEGTAAKIVLMALSQADLAIVPTQGSQLDAEQAGRAIKAIRDAERITRKPLPFGVLLTRTSPAIRTRSTAHVWSTLSKAAIPMFDTELNEREAFRAVFSFRAPLEALDSSAVANLDKAIANAQEFAAEVVQKLRGHMVHSEERAA
jgi:chromosome partitioning protein